MLRGQDDRGGSWLQDLFWRSHAIHIHFRWFFRLRSAAWQYWTGGRSSRCRKGCIFTNKGEHLGRWRGRQEWCWKYWVGWRRCFSIYGMRMCRGFEKIKWTLRSNVIGNVIFRRGWCVFDCRNLILLINIERYGRHVWRRTGMFSGTASLWWRQCLLGRIVFIISKPHSFFKGEGIDRWKICFEI